MKSILVLILASLMLMLNTGCESLWGGDEEETPKTTESTAPEATPEPGQTSLRSAIFANECTNSRTSDVFIGTHPELGDHKLWFVRDANDDYLVIKARPGPVTFDPPYVAPVAKAQVIHMAYDNGASLTAEPGQTPFVVDLESAETDGAGKSFQYGGSYTTIDGKKFSKITGVLSCDKKSLTLGGITYQSSPPATW